jgi:hypothetical protein
MKLASTAGSFPADGFYPLAREEWKDAIVTDDAP